MGGVWLDPLQRAKRATRADRDKAGEASQSERMRTVVVPETRDWIPLNPLITQTNNYTYRTLKTIHKISK